MKVIDFHVHPLVKEAFEEDKNLWNAQKEVFVLFTSPQPISTLINQLKEVEVEKAVLLPIDCSSKWNYKIPSNEIVAKIVEKFPEIFIGFASIDPNKEGAIEELNKSIKKLNLKGVKLNPAMQSFDPLSEKAKEIYNEINDM
ncbi:MAG: amidohydrolase family protein, partial [Nitrososphaerota archaeon]